MAKKAKVFMEKGASGLCPKCSKDDIEYDGMQIEGDMLYYRARCNDCDFQFNEWYELNFVESRGEE